MKKLLALCSLPLALLAFSVACDDGSAATDCADDADCADLADTPTCDPDLLICVADDTECAANTDCQVKTNEGAADNAECDATADCDDGEVCALGFEDQGFCVVPGDAAACDLVGAASINVDIAGGGTNDVCVDANAQCTDGACGYP